MQGGMSCFATQSPYEDVGDGAVVEPDEANSVANSDDAAATVTGLHMHATKVGRLDERTHRKRMRKVRQEERTVMFVRVEPTTLTWPVPPSEIPTSPPMPLACIPHAVQARVGNHSHRFPTIGTSSAAEGYADTVDCAAECGRLCARNANEK
jgi:hypothetical protein